MEGDGAIPWETIRYLVGSVMYGGRCIDHMDRRVLKTYCEEFFFDGLFDSFQKFYFYKDSEVGSTHSFSSCLSMSHESDRNALPLSLKVEYGLPSGNQHSDYVEYIEALPLANSPEVFGLHPNAEIGYYTETAKSMWSQLIELQPQQTTTGSSISREEFIGNIAAGIQAKLPETFDLERVRGTIGVPSPTQIVLLQELERFNALTTAMKASLAELQKVCLRGWGGGGGGGGRGGGKKTKLRLSTP